VPTGENQPVNRQSPFRLWRIIAVAVVAALAGGTLYYGLSLARANTFNDERAFRVLGDVATQFKSLETSRATILRSMPVLLTEIMPGCSEGENFTPKNITLPSWMQDSAAPLATEFLTNYYRGYLSQLDLGDASLCRYQANEQKLVPTPKSAQLGSPSSRTPSSNRNPSAQSTEPPPRSFCENIQLGEILFHITLDHRLTTILCAKDAEYRLDEPFFSAAEHFISQDFFSETILTLSDGTVLGEFPHQDTSSPYTRVKLQFPVAETINILNAHDLIGTRSPATNSLPRVGGDDPASLSGTSEPVREPSAFDQNIAQQDYRVYILPFAGSENFIPDRHTQSSAEKTNAQLDAFLTLTADGHHRNLASSKSESNPPQEDAFYILGLKSFALSDSIFYALWPVGLWLLTLLTVLSILLWPLVRLQFGPVSESISRRKAVACLFAAIMIPAVLIIAAASLWSYFELKGWASADAQSYAQALERALRQELVDGADILNSYAPVYERLGNCGAAPSKDFLDDQGSSHPTIFVNPCKDSNALQPRPYVGYHNDRTPMYAGFVRSLQASAGACTTIQLEVCPSTGPESTWSPFRNILALDSSGQRIGPVFTVFDPIDLKPNLNLANREYFQAVKAGEAWQVTDTLSHSVLVVAQRLFNRNDASKTLELAVPRCKSAVGTAEPAFCGVITGDMRMHGLLISTPPTLMRFAVIDTQTGTVIFHSNDGHSLAENFFLESELAPMLSAAIDSKRSSFYAGRYIGDPHNFYYEPIQGTPWAVVVFFPEKDLADLPFRAGSAALSAYAGSLFAVVLVFLTGRLLWCAILFPRGPHRPLIEYLWPDRPLAPVYLAFGQLRPTLWASAALLIVTIFGLTNRVRAIFIVSAILICIATLFRLLRKWPRRGRSEGATTPAQNEHAFIEGSAAIVFVISIIPAYLLFICFNNLQIEGLLRDELVRSIYQKERRYDLIRSDLHHWVTPSSDQHHPWAYPSLWTLAFWPDFGVSGTRPTSDNPPEPGTPISVHVDAFERLIWENVADSPQQLRRLQLLESDAPDPPKCTLLSDAHRARCQVSMSDGTPDSIEITRPGNYSLFWDGFAWFGPHAIAITLAFALACVSSLLVCRLLARGLIGLSASYMVLPLGGRETKSTQANDAVFRYSKEQFRNIWLTLPQSARLLLYQLSLQQLANPRNESSVELLLNHGLISVDPFPKVRTPELRKLVLNAEPATAFADLQNRASKGAWKIIGPALFIGLMIMVAWLSWAAGGIMKAVSAILLATVAFLGQIAQLIALARGGFVRSPSAFTELPTPNDKQ
jgi:hypothetical protein